MKHVKQREEFVNEEFNLDKSKDFIKGLIDKVRNIIPKEKIHKFIEENREQVEEVGKMLSDGNGKIDYDKTKDFIKNKVKNV